MEDNTTSQWSGAALDGLLLSLFTIFPSLLSVFVTNGVVSAICWVIKTGGSLYFLYLFMKKWAAGSGAQSAFGYGFRICLCSAVICAAWSYALYEWITPDKVTEVFETLYAAMPMQTLPSETEDALNLLEDNFSQFSCVTTLMACTLEGLIFSAIFGRSAASANIFSENEKNEDEEL